MADPELSDTMETINNVDHDEPLLDLASFFEMAASDPLDPIEDLAVFFENAATIEDPIDDLAIFLENAMRWACTDTLIGPDGTFWLFSRLAGELRIMVWNECIPSQIHLTAEHVYGDDKDPLHDYYPMLYHHRNCQQPALPTAFGQKVPLIAQINREARDVALTYLRQHVKRCWNLAYVHPNPHIVAYGIDELPVWLNMKTDTVLINDECLPAEDHPETAIFRAGETAYVRTNRLLGMVDRGMIKTAIFSDLLRLLSPLTYHRLTGGQRVQVVVGVLQFTLISDREAGLTGLFGHFGEEKMALVPLDDQPLRKLHAAHCTFSGWYTGESIPSLVDRTFFPDDVSHYSFKRYRACMRKFARRVMNEVMTKLANSPEGDPFEDDPLAAAQWELDVYGSFYRVFEPVFLVHRCGHKVLLTEMDEW